MEPLAQAKALAKLRRLEESMLTPLDNVRAPLGAALASGIALKTNRANPGAFVALSAEDSQGGVLSCPWPASTLSLSRASFQNAGPPSPTGRASGGPPPAPASSPHCLTRSSLTELLDPQERTTILVEFRAATTLWIYRFQPSIARNKVNK